MANPIFHSQYTAQQIEGLIEHGVPIIQNGTFWRWDIVSQQYVDTGVRADSEQAAEDAGAARDAAVAAKEAAVTAQGAAETAQRKAEDAAEHAEEVVDNKADVDGDYDELTVGTARQIVGSSGASDSAPYTFRKTGGGVSVGNRAELQQIVGGTVARNQLVADKTETIAGISQTIIRGKVTLNGTATNAAPLNLASNVNRPAHKIMVITDNSAHEGCQYVVSDMTNGVNLKYIDTGYEMPPSVILIPSNCTNARFYFIVQSGTVFDNFVFTYMCFDLTQMFGSAIADYIYSLETATAGAGVAKLREWGYDLSTYHAYNAGTLESVKTSGKTAVGFNQWDEEWEVGIYNANTGEKYDNNNAIRTKNRIAVLPSATYYAKTPNQIYKFFYDSNGDYISGGGSSSQNSTFTTPSNAHYMNFYVTSGYGTTYNHDICINLSNPARNGTYEPYNAHTYALDPVELRGIPMLDSENNLYYNGDSYLPDGTVTRRYVLVDLGAVRWTYLNIEGHTRFTYNITSPSEYAVKSDAKANAICTKYEVYPNRTIFNNVAVGLAVHSDGDQILVYDPAYTDAGTFKTAMTGVYLVYELATPTTETAAPYQQMQIVDADGTEAYTDAGVEAGDRDIAIPVGHETFYPADLTGAIERVMVQVPPPPSGNGNYRLTATVSASGVTYSWEAV